MRGGDGDNGQNGLKLVMDYYGPQVPFFGGALCGKGFFNIDRVAAMAAREAEVDCVRGAVEEWKIPLAYVQ